MIEKQEGNTPISMAVGHSRRNAMRKIAIGIGILAGTAVLPERWTRPIIGQILLPSHAGTSGSIIKDPCTLTVVDGNTDSSVVTVRVDGFVTPPVANLSTLIAAQGEPDKGSTTANTTTSSTGTFTATISIGGGPGIASVSVITTVTGASGQASCSISIPSPNEPTTTTSTTPGPEPTPTPTPTPTPLPEPTPTPAPTPTPTPTPTEEE